MYDAWALKQDLKPYITGVVMAFGIVPAAEADVASLDERLNQGLPLMFLPQIAEMEDAFNDGGFVSLDSFIAGANARARHKGHDQPAYARLPDPTFLELLGQNPIRPRSGPARFRSGFGKRTVKTFSAREC